MVTSRQESTSPETIIEGLVSASLSDQDNKCRQILILAPQAVGEPCPDAGSPRNLSSTWEEGNSRVMINGFRVHRSYQGDLVHNSCSVRHQLADPSPGIALLSELEDRRDHRKTVLSRRHA